MPDKQFRQMPSWWKQDVAIKNAHKIGLETKVIDGNNYIENKWRKAWVSFDMADFIPYRAYLLEMHDWNGWECPFLPVDEAERLCNNESPESPSLFIMRDGKLFYRFEGDEEEIEKETITVGGQPVEVYEVGRGLCWSECFRSEVRERLVEEVKEAGADAFKNLFGADCKISINGWSLNF